MASSVNENSGSKGSGQGALLGIVMLGLFLAILNQTLLNVALPHLINEFGVTASSAQWLLTGYMLVNGALIPLSAFLIERFGVRKLFLFAMFVFTLGSLICGIATTFPIMLAGRLVQAVGGGVLAPLVMAIIVQIFPPEMRGKGMGIFGLAMMFAPAVGPTLSGWIVENYDWHLLFEGMVPLGVIVFVFAYFKLRDIQEGKKIKLDVFGATTSLLGMGFLLYGFSEAGQDGWTDPVVLSTMIIGVILLAMFVIQQLRSPHPMLDMRVFKFNIFTLSSVINIALTISMYAGMYLVPIYLQNIRGYTPLDSGLLLLPGAIVMLIMSPISGILFDKIGPRPLGIVGMIITVITTYQFTQLTLTTSYAHLLIVYMCRMFGMSLLMMPIMTAGLNQLPSRLNNHGSSMSNTLRQVSGSIGISLVTTIFTNRTTFHLGTLTENMNTSNTGFMQSFHELTVKIASAMHVPMEQAQQTAVKQVYANASEHATVMGINDAFFWATGIAFIGLILSFFLRDVRKDSQPKEAIEPVQEETKMLPAPKTS